MDSITQWLDSVQLLHHFTQSGDAGFLRTVVAQLEKDGKLPVDGSKVANGSLPIDFTVIGHQMVVLFTGVIVNMSGGHTLLHLSESRVHAGGHVGVTRVETDLQVQARVVNEVQQT